MPVWGKRNAPVIPNLPTAGSAVIVDLIPLVLCTEAEEP
jgi:hypothetical protein